MICVHETILVLRLQLPLSPMLEDGITHRLDKVG
jgi:hypothetical protein